MKLNVYKTQKEKVFLLLCENASLVVSVDAYDIETCEVDTHIIQDSHISELQNAIYERFVDYLLNEINTLSSIDNIQLDM